MFLPTSGRARTVWTTAAKFGAARRSTEKIVKGGSPLSAPRVPVLSGASIDALLRVVLSFDWSDFHGVAGVVGKAPRVRVGAASGMAILSFSGVLDVVALRLAVAAGLPLPRAGDGGRNRR